MNMIFMLDDPDGATAIRRSVMPLGSSRATRMVTASAKSMSTPWRGSGHCSARGCVPTEGCRKRSCLCIWDSSSSVSYTHLRAHETRHDLVCRLLLEKKKKSH